MSDQNSDFSQEFSHHHQENTAIVATALNLLAMLHLNSTATLSGGNHQSATTAIAPLSSTTSMDNQCTECRSTKRQSPSSLPSLQEPSSKRANILPSTSITTSAGRHRILGFSKLQLPPIFSNAASSSSPSLLRTISDPINSPGANNLSDQAPNSVGSFLNRRLPESSATSSADTWPSQPLYRSISDPFSASYQVVTTTTPPRPPPAARQPMKAPSVGGSGPDVKEKSPNTKRRLKRMKDRLREMRQWWNEVIKEDEEDNDSADDDNLPKDEPEVSQVTESDEGRYDEAVWVERNGECLILHFKCPCGKGYQILLSGKNCYYKLTAF